MVAPHQRTRGLHPDDENAAMIHRFAVARKAVWLQASLILLLALPFDACGNAEPTNPDDGRFGENPTGVPADPDPVPGDSIPAPNPDSTPPQDSTAPPVPSGPSVPPTHVGIPFGPAHMPPERFAEYSGTIYTATKPDRLMRDLETARRANTRMFISFVGNAQFFRDSNGFSLTMWKQRVDRFRGLDLIPYIADGTIIGHFILDEPDDPSNWNGIRVPQAMIEEMASYSKQLWPTMVAMVRTFPWYLEGHQYPHLDANRVQYLDRFSPIDSFINANVQGTQALGLALVGGLNVLNGGSKTSGIPGRKVGKFGMNPDELRSWGKRYLSESYICAFILYEYDSTYLSRPGIREALAELGEVARSRPKKECRP
jgi:hypothetical protein